MSSQVTEAVASLPQQATVYLECERWNEDSIKSATVKPREDVTSLGVYPLFICVTSLLTVFFVVSLILGLTTQYFLDWGSALVGFLGSLGLTLVGWFSKHQIKG